VSTSRLQTIRFLALLVMIAGVVVVPFAFYYGLGGVFRSGFRGELTIGSQHAMRVAMFKFMGGLLLCQVLIGGGGFARWKCKKLLAAKAPPKSASI
jgi:hypothetical protein